MNLDASCLPESPMYLPFSLSLLILFQYFTDVFRKRNKDPEVGTCELRGTVYFRRIACRI